MSKARKSSTEASIVEAAERLFSQRGIEGVSLREIGELAGSANNYAVQYHFGDRLALVNAVVERRLPFFEKRRGELLSNLAENGMSEDPKCYIEVLLRPISEIRSEDGHFTYAGFLRGLSSFERSESFMLRTERLAPLSSQVIARLIRVLPPIPQKTFELRMDLAASVFFECLAGSRHRANFDAEALISEGLRAANAILCAPAGTPVTSPKAEMV